MEFDREGKSAMGACERHRRRDCFWPDWMKSGDVEQLATTGVDAGVVARNNGDNGGVHMAKKQWPVFLDIYIYYYIFFCFVCSVTQALKLWV